MDILNLFLTLLVAVIGALVFLKLKAPAGAFLGAMLFVALFNIFTNFVYFPVQARVYIRIFAGAVVGARMKKSDVISMKTIVFPAILLVFGMLALNLILGYGIHRLTGLELMTSMLGAAPGGVQDMALIAEDLGANAAQIAVLQSVRFFAVLGISPVFLRAFVRKYSPVPDQEAIETLESSGLVSSEESSEALSGASSGTIPETDSKTKSVKLKRDMLSFFRTMVFAFICGLLVNMTPLPAGSMVGGMLGAVLATLLIKPSYVPVKVRTATQVCAGTLIGCTIGMEELISLKEILVPAVILVIVLFIANFAFGLLIHKVTKLDLATSMFGTAAGGVTDMALIADELGADSPKVAILQFLRMVCIIIFSPTIIRFFSGIVVH